MRILISHLTRMRPGFVCIAGVATDLGVHIRPVLPGGRQLERRLLESEGGPIALGTVVDIGPTEPQPVVPEVEDHGFVPENAAKVRAVKPEDFLSFLVSVTNLGLLDIFGPDLERLSGTAAAVPKGYGAASLGILKLESPSLWFEKYWGKPVVRMSFVDTDLGDLTLMVADIRLWESDHVTPSARDVELIGESLSGCFVSVGLTRAYEVSRYPGSRHWLQVNNVFPLDNPLWSRS